MIRGAQKKMIVIRTHDSRVFEEAYFVMRKETEATVEDGDMLTEADRIIRRSTAGMTAAAIPDPERRESAGERRRQKMRGILWFFAGVLAGGGCVGFLLWML